MTAPGLLTEVELLRRRLLEMEGKDEELARMARQCRDLDRRLAAEAGAGRGLRSEVDRLNGRIGQLDRLEEALGRSRQDCLHLRGSLERERAAGRALAGELDALRLRVRDLEAAEARLEDSEAAVRRDLGRLRSLTAALAEDRRSAAERLQQAEERLRRRDGPGWSAPADRRPGSRSDADLEEKVRTVVKEKDELQTRLQAEEERNRELQGRISSMKNTTFSRPTGENRVQDLVQELDRLRRRLQDQEVLQDDVQALQRKLEDEQRRTRGLEDELALTRDQLGRYRRAEKQEVNQEENQEHVLLRHLQKEQVKNRLLTREVAALKEQLQALNTAETDVCRVQLDRQEARNQDLAREVEELGGELHGYRRVQTPEARTGSSDGHRTSREVQTEPLRVADGDEKDPANPEVSRTSSRVDTSTSTRVRTPPGPDLPPPPNGEVMTLTHTPGQPLHIKVTPHHALNTATLEISSPSSGAGASAAAPYTSTAIIPAAGAATPKQRITIIQRTPSCSPDRTGSVPDGPPGSPACAAAPDGSPVQLVTVQACSPDPASPLCQTPERHQRPGGSDGGPSFITTEDSKIHIHMGSPATAPGATAATAAPGGVNGSYFLRHEQRTQVITNGSHVKGVGKITSSITISAAGAPPAASNITVSGLYD
ncbi:filamin A-interacting protein 1-like [Cololabis saira]|uniref:filamin A-interacting protein 1-like n=1 Tax=Cololabis saira TaxID=129043 RepID=UPI002AD3BA4B|nr:filamin A-interacting protein 1-like [Cololabis saira]